jgi:ketosteroid isomerase-like protein
MNEAPEERVIILPRMRNDAPDRTRRLGHAVCALALGMAACASLPRERPRNELADAVRAFAADCAARGITASFVAHFAPDGLVFEPVPTRVRETWPARPASPDPEPRLTWHPELVDVSLAGDLGYSTGPFEIVDAARTRPPLHGAFFSVWQRQGDGQWKVWLDLGARTGTPVDAAAWRRPRVRDDVQTAEHATATTVTTIDRALSDLDAEGFARRLALDARQQRNGAQPAIGDAWVRRFAEEGARYDYAPSEARVSASGDLAASYGRVTRRDRDGKQQSGHYVHVWVRDQGSWWLAAESLVYEAA